MKDVEPLDMARILFVENHAVFANQVTRAFLNDHEVTTVPGLSEARAVLAKGRVDAVLVDYDLEDGKGAELVAELQSRWPRPFVVAVSSHDEGNTAMLAAGADAVCGKMEFSRIGSVIARGLTQPLQPPRAAQPFGQRDTARLGPRG